MAAKTRCTICRREVLRQEIDRMLLGGSSHREIEQRFAGEVGISRTTVSRHRNNCLKPSLAAAPTKSDRKLAAVEGSLEPDKQSVGLVRVTWDRPVDSAASAVSFMQHLLFRVTAILDKAENSENPRIAMAAIKEVRDTLMAHAKLQGFVRDTPTQDNRQVNIFSGLGVGELLEIKKALGVGEEKQTQ